MNRGTIKRMLEYSNIIGMIIGAIIGALVIQWIGSGFIFEGADLILIRITTIILAIIGACIGFFIGDEL